MQRIDDAGAQLAHVIRHLRGLDETKWDNALGSFAASFTYTHPEIRRILEVRSRTKLVAGLFAYNYFEDAHSVITPAFFNRAHHVSMTVSVNISQ